MDHYNTSRIWFNPPDDDRDCVCRPGEGLICFTDDPEAARQYIRLYDADGSKGYVLCAWNSCPACALCGHSHEADCESARLDRLIALASAQNDQLFASGCASLARLYAIETARRSLAKHVNAA